MSRDTHTGIRLIDGMPIRGRAGTEVGIPCIIGSDGLRASGREDQRAAAFGDITGKSALIQADFTTRGAFTSDGDAATRSRFAAGVFTDLHTDFD